MGGLLIMVLFVAMGPNAGRYVQEVVESGLTCDMVGRFERAFAEELGVRHCVATPGCTNPDVTWIMRPRRANRLRPSSHPPMSLGSVMRSRVMPWIVSPGASTGSWNMKAELP